MEKSKLTTEREFIGSISDELDRIEVFVGKIGMNRPEQATEILYRLDAVMTALRSLENEVSIKQAEGQLEGILARLRREASLFLRDLGGANKLRAEREKASPPEENWWWWLDEFVVTRRKASARRSLITFGILAGVLAVLAVVYQLFLAPPPEVAARYMHEQSARDRMMSGELDTALDEVEQGLSYVPGDPTLLTLRGVVLESQGDLQGAERDFAAAEQGIGSREDFLTLRGQAYLMIDDTDRALVDAEESVQINPDLARGYLLIGQVNETKGFFAEALASYERAYEAAEKAGQTEMAALSRTRIAMMMQMWNAQISPFEDMETQETP
jgi:tetratricopeptide (TPR) repeat protein